MDPQLQQDTNAAHHSIKDVVRNPRIVGIAAGGVILLAIAIAIIVLNRPPTPPVIPPDTETRLPDGAVAQVGDETLSKDQLDFYTGSLPSGTAKEEGEKIAIDRLVEDTVILNGGIDDGIINLDETEKERIKTDMEKRYEYVEQVKKAVEDRSERIAGKIIAIWFLNERVGPLGYEGSRKLAFSKISNLHQRVKSGVLTIDQAAQLIKSDSQIAQLDNAYKANALITFDTTRESSITFNNELNDIIWKMNKGEISDVIVVKDRQPNPAKPIPDLDKHDRNTEYVRAEALYVFVKVEDKVQGSVRSYKDWYAEKERSYKVQINNNAL